MANRTLERRQALLGLLAMAGLGAPRLAHARDAAAEPPRVMPEEVKRLVAQREAVIVDVRPKEAYDFEHAEGAISIPLDQLEGRLAELPKDKFIAAYCT